MDEAPPDQGENVRQARALLDRLTSAIDARAADHYVYALTDYREVDRSIALARVDDQM